MCDRGLTVLFQAAVINEWLDELLTLVEEMENDNSIENMVVAGLTSDLEVAREIMSTFGVICERFEDPDFEPSSRAPADYPVD